MKMTKSSSFSMVLNFINNLHDFGVEEMKIVFCCCGCSSWENIDIEKKW